MGIFPSLGTITHVEYDMIVGGFFVFVCCCILLHCYYRRQYRRQQSKYAERLDSYDSEWNVVSDGENEDGESEDEQWGKDGDPDVSSIMDSYM